MTQHYSQHPLSAAYPSMSDEDFGALVEDIRQHGQRDVATLCDGMVLDGWHRYQACIELGIPCRFEQFAGEDPVAFVRSKNHHRRHLQKSQYAVIEVSLSSWAEAHRPNKAAATAAFSKSAGQSLDYNKAAATAAFSTNEDMAERAGTSERTIRQAKRAVEAGLGDFVKEGLLTAENAAAIAKDKELAAKVAAGEISPDEALRRLKEDREPRPLPQAQPLPPLRDLSPDYDGAPDDDEMAEVQAELDAQRHALDVLLAADDKLEAARKEIVRQQAEISALKRSRDGYMNEAAEWKRRYLSEKRAREKLERKVP